jgi:hypothetical protein
VRTSHGATVIEIFLSVTKVISKPITLHIQSHKQKGIRDSDRPTQNQKSHFSILRMMQ